MPARLPADDLDPKSVVGRVEAARERLQREFGLPLERLAGVRWLARRDSVWAHGVEAWPLDAWRGHGGWRFVAAGLRVFKADRRFGERPTNDALRWLGADMTRRVVKLEPPRLLDLLEGQALPAEGGGGLVALRTAGHVVGRGVVRRGRLEHEIPKARAQRLREVLKRRLGVGTAV